jgi:N-acetylneuraminic acid mutarotase
MKSFYLLLCILICHSTFSQDTTRQWSWESGSNLTQQAPVYGTKGVADATAYPGSRSGAATWTTSDGKLWLFGGEGFNSSGTSKKLNDLWMYDPATKQWTWKHGPTINDPESFSFGTKGVASASNLPRIRTGASTWVDHAGNLWLFGGAHGAGMQIMNDMWKYVPSTNQWTWISGSSAVAFDEGGKGTLGVPDPASYPRALTNASATVDPAGNLWLFGGYTEVLFTDDVWYTTRLVWKFDPVSNLWTYYSDDDDVYHTLRTQSHFGTKGVASADNLPPTRMSASLWADSSGHLYWFGGVEYYFIGEGSDDLQFATALRDDVWRYDTLTRIWTWVQGSDQRGAPVHHGAKGVPDAANTPGARTSAGFLPVAGEFVLYGGGAYYADGYGIFTDLWSFNPVTGLWTWTGGSNQPGQPAVYGTKGVADPANHPLPSDMPFTDPSGNFWLYSGAALWKSSPVKDEEDSVEVFDSFDAKYKNQYVELKWKIAKDQHTDYIVVEHSRNGNSFSPLGRVQAPRNGNSRNYSYIHMLPGNGDHYYRLKHVDKQGQSAYSWVEKVVVSHSFDLPYHFNLSFQLFPNPVRNWVYINFNARSSAHLQMVVYNSYGQPLMRQQQHVSAGYNTLKVNLNRFQRGVYTVVFTVDGKVYTKKIIKL